MLVSQPLPIALHSEAFATNPQNAVLLSECFCCFFAFGDVADGDDSNGLFLVCQRLGDQFDVEFRAIFSETERFECLLDSCVYGIRESITRVLGDEIQQQPPDGF